MYLLMLSYLSILQQMEMVTQWMGLTAQVFHFMLQLLWYSVYSHSCVFNVARDSTHCPDVHKYTTVVNTEPKMHMVTNLLWLKLNLLLFKWIKCHQVKMDFCWFKSAMETRQWDFDKNLCWISIMWYVSVHIE